MKKITIVTKSLLSGGAERVVATLANYAAKNDIECSIVLMRDWEISYNLDERIQLHIIGEQSSNPLINKIKGYIKVRSEIIKSNPDVVLAMPEEIGIYIIPLMFGTGIPVVVSERNNPWVMPYKKITRILRKMVYPFSKGYVFQTPMAASFFSKKIQNKGTIIPNPLDVSKIPEPHVGERKKTVVSAGRFENQKNFKLLIGAFTEFYKTHSEYSLRIYGEGGLRNELESYAKSLLPDGIWSMPGRDIEWLKQSVDCSMFVLSSDFEGMPNALIEAMAAGVPSISTDCPSGGSSELIENNKNGILVPVNDKQSMVAAMNKIADSKAFADEISERGTNLKELLYADKVSQQWIEYLKECINSVS